MSWLTGYGSAPPRPPAAEAPALAAASVAPTVARCPACSSDAVKVASSARGISYLACVECRHEWKTNRAVRRVLLLS